MKVKEICSFDNCDTISKVRGVCGKHYNAIYKSNSNCKSCGSSFIKGSFTGICKPCKSGRVPHNKLSNSSLYTNIENSVLNELKWLLLRYKWDTFSSVDVFRATSIHSDIFIDEVELDSLVPYNQVLHIMNDLMLVYKKNRP